LKRVCLARRRGRAAGPLVPGAGFEPATNGLQMRRGALMLRIAVRDPVAALAKLPGIEFAFQGLATLRP